MPGLPGLPPGLRALWEAEREREREPRSRYREVRIAHAISEGGAHRWAVTDGRHVGRGGSLAAAVADFEAESER